MPLKQSFQISERFRVKHIEKLSQMLERSEDNPKNVLLGWEETSNKFLCRAHFMCFYKTEGKTEEAEKFWNFVKNGDEKELKGIKYQDVFYKEYIKKFKELIQIQTTEYRFDQVILILPPTKKSKKNQMKWICDEIKMSCKEFVKGHIEIDSECYNLKSNKKNETRKEALEGAMKSWETKFASDILRNKENLFIYIDDIFTAGGTLFTIIGYFRTKLPDIYSKLEHMPSNNGYKYLKNLEVFCVGRTYSRDNQKWIHQMSTDLEQLLNRNPDLDLNNKISSND
jgi:hypothetical protein